MKLLPVAGLVCTSAALGINCRGSTLCLAPQSGFAMLGIHSALGHFIDDGGGDKYYREGEQIGCTDKLCAFFQNGASGTARDAYDYLGLLLDHGCEECGSVPTIPAPHENDVSFGELTVNGVSDPACDSNVSNIYNTESCLT